MNWLLRLTALFLLITALAACGNESVGTDRSLPELAVAAVKLTNGTPIKNISGTQNSQKTYTLSVAGGATNLKFTLSGGSGNADLYVRFGSAPTLSSYTCRPYKTGNNESCTVATPKAGTYYVMLRGRAAYTSAQLVGQYQAAPASNQYAVTFVFGPNVTATQKQLFTNAGARWSRIITGDVASVTLSKPTNACGANEPAFNGTIDDIVIYAEVGPIDGPSNILAQAGPCYVRNNYLPTYGVMKFDSADVNGFDLNAIILHEMGHVFGVGVLWPYLNLVNYAPGSCPTTPQYFGASALQDWRAFGKTNNIPVEDNGGPGTACGHWDEETFNHELMTGYIEPSGSMPLSRMTAGSLQDVGYIVDKGAADAYNLPACSPGCMDLRPASNTSREVLIRPRRLISPWGEVRDLVTFK